MEELTLDMTPYGMMLVSKGEITLESSHGHRARMDKAFAVHRPEHVVWDLSQVTFIDSSGIGLLVSCNTRAQSSGAKLWLYRPSPQVRKILSLVKLLEYFGVIEDETQLKSMLPY